MKFELKYLLFLQVPLSFYCGSRFVDEISRYPFEKVSCTIKSGEIVTPDDNSKLRNRAEIVFSCDDPTVGIYNWKDFSEKPAAQEFLNQYKPGSTVIGYKKGTKINLWRKPLWIFGVYLIPIAVLVFSLNKIVPKSRPQPVLNRPEKRTIIKSPVFSQSSAVVLEENTDLKRIYGAEDLKNITGLKPRHAQLCQFIGLLAGAIILSAISVFAGLRAYKTFKSGESAGCAPPWRPLQH